MTLEDVRLVEWDADDHDHAHDADPFARQPDDPLDEHGPATTQGDGDDT